jgi:hypothetical protein
MGSKEIFSIMALIAIIIIPCTTYLFVTDEPNADTRLYCEMNDVRIESNGEFGWPDYNRNYDEVCV